MTQRLYHELYDIDLLFPKVQTKTPHELARSEYSHLGDPHKIAAVIWWVINTKFPESWQQQVKRGKPGRPRKDK